MKHIKSYLGMSENVQYTACTPKNAMFQVGKMTRIQWMDWGTRFSEPYNQKNTGTCVDKPIAQQQIPDFDEGTH